MKGKEPNALTMGSGRLPLIWTGRKKAEPLQKRKVDSVLAFRTRGNNRQPADVLIPLSWGGGGGNCGRGKGAASSSLSMFIGPESKKSGRLAA